VFLPPRDFLQGEEELDGLKSGYVWDELAAAEDTAKLYRSFQIMPKNIFVTSHHPKARHL